MKHFGVNWNSFKIWYLGYLWFKSHMLAFNSLLVFVFWLALWKRDQHWWNHGYLSLCFLFWLDLLFCVWPLWSWHWVSCIFRSLFIFLQSVVNRLNSKNSWIFILKNKSEYFSLSIRSLTYSRSPCLAIFEGS